MTTRVEGMVVPKNANEVVADSAFKLRDTLARRTELGKQAKKLNQNMVIASGLGATSAFLLDCLVQTARRWAAEGYHLTVVGHRVVREGKR